ncbi:DUF2249 domain-containing protein [Pannonibacter sp. Pt2-lr]
MTVPQFETIPAIDVCGLPCAIRRALVCETFDALLPGSSFELVNDRDPSPSRRSLPCGPLRASPGTLWKAAR